MNIISFAIENPVKVTVGVILVLLFGVLAVTAIPVQMTPDVDRPLVRVTTIWPGRSPEEIERSLLQEQEEQLKTIPGLSKMTSTAEVGLAKVEMEFDINVSMDRALQEVSNKLDEVPDYPDNVERPVIKASSSAEESAIAVCFVQSKYPTYDVAEFYDYFDRHIKPYLERIPGVSEVDLKGGREHEVHIQIDPYAVARRGLTWKEIRTALQMDNVNESGGDLSDGRLDVRYRVIGQYDDLDRIRKTVISYDNGTPVRIEDVAKVTLTLEKNTHFDRSEGAKTMGLLLRRETGANVVKLMNEFRKRLAETNKPGGLCAQFKHDRYEIRMHMIYDETEYINDAISLVTDNLLIGGVLAGMVLLLFLRSVRPTMIVALAIPISVVGTFVVMHLAGRNLNVVSLAGLSFAVGMVVDNAIVVLENIDRHLHMGEPPLTAAYRGTKEVWGAILSSTLTTIAVFAPVLTVKEEAGQLFHDIALAVCAAVGFSLIVSITVIPAAAAVWLKPKARKHGVLWASFHGLFGLARGGDWLGRKYARLIHMLTFRSVAGVWARVVIIAVITVISVIGAKWMAPPASYLPNGNRNFIMAMMFTPPSYSYEQNVLLGNRIEQQLKPYWEAKNSAEATAIKPLFDMKGQPIKRVSAIEEQIMIVSRGRVFMFFRSQDAQHPKELIPILQDMMKEHPGCYGYSMQPSIFGRFAGGDSVDVELVGNSMENLRLSASALQQRLFKRFSQFSIRTNPQSFELSGPERQIVIDQVRAKELGLNVNTLAVGVRGLIDGTVVGDFNFEGDTIDIVLIRDPDIPMSPEDLANVPLAVKQDNDDGVTHLPLSDLVEIRRADASKSIKRVEQQRAITFTVNPPGTMALEEARAEIEKLLEEARLAGEITADISVRFSGNADRLSQTQQALLGKWNGFNAESLMSVGFSRFFLALLITFLLMAALFESFIYPLVIMFSVPMAMVGGFMGLTLVRSAHPDQQLDTLTMLGFIILVGIVVNNAILLVHQALNFMRGVGEVEGDVREPMEPRQAIAESVRTRIRPILMTTATSVCGMIPLVMAPGSGSEIYRGLGGVVVGGLSISTIFTLLVVPLMLSLVIDIRTGLARLLGREFKERAAHVDTSS